MLESRKKVMVYDIFFCFKRLQDDDHGFHPKQHMGMGERMT